MEFPICAPLTKIPFLWGGNSPKTGLDCFTLSSYARTSQGRSPLPSHNWVYQTYSEEAFPAALMVKLCQDALNQVVRSPLPFDVVVLRGESISLGTCLMQDSKLKILHFSPKGFSVMTDLEAIKRSRLILGVFEADVI